MASRYSGLSAGERTSMAGLAAIAALLLLALLLLARGAEVILRYNANALTLFDVARPPPPPPTRLTQQVHRTAPRRATHPAARARRPDPGSRSARLPSPAPPSIVPIEAVLPSIVDVGPTLVDHGLTSALAAGSPGQGVGSGAGDGGTGGDGDQTPYFRADWIRKPTQEEVDREWPRSLPPPTEAIRVLLVCEVRPNGHPFRCIVGRETPPGKHVGRIAIRLAEAARVKPVMHGAKIADPHVVIPFYFKKRSAGASPAQ